MSQYNKNRILRLCAYFLKKLSKTEKNYDIYNKELLALIFYLKK